MTEIYQHIKKKSIESMTMLTSITGGTSPPNSTINMIDNPPISPNQTDYEEIKSNFKTFLNKKLQAAQQLIKKPKTHTCKITVVTSERNLQLAVADGTIMNEGLEAVFLKGDSSIRESSSNMFKADDILELGFEFDLPFDINSTTMLNEILTFPNLYSITLKTNYISAVPSQIFQIKNLKVLSLASNQIKTLGSELGTLRRLVTLNLSSNQLTALPKEIGNLFQLRYLYLSSNNLTSLPTNINQLTNLRVLDLNNNRISTLPEMTGLVLLEELQLENNLLGYVDPSAETIIDRVKTIVTANSNIKALVSLTSLSTLNLKNNKLVNPPELIMSALPNLSKIDLSCNSIQLTVGEMLLSHCITVVDLSHNMLTNVSPKIVGLVSLKELNLSFNQLSSLPAEMVLMNSLEVLKVSHNQLKDRLDPIPQMTQLRSLHLSANGITTLPAAVYNLTKLHYLNLAKNELKLIPSIVVERLVHLRKLDISENRLVALPYSIHYLTELKCLRLHYNKISVLPRELSQLTSLTELSVKNLYVNGETGDLNIIASQEEQRTGTAPHLRLCDLLSLIRSSPHPLLVFALYLMSEEEDLQKRVVEEGGLADVIYMIRHCHGRTQIEATKILANLSNSDFNREMIFLEGAAEMVIQTLLDTSSEIESKIHALVTLGNIALQDENRRSILAMKNLIEILQQLAKTEVDDSRLKKYARRTLAILGILDALPQQRGVRILALDGGGSRGVSTLELLRRVEQGTGKKIHEMFDLICGTSAGGMTASCLAVKHYTLDRIRVLQEKLCYEIFAHGVTQPAPDDFISSQIVRIQTRLSGASNLLRSGAVYSTKLYEEMLQALSGEDTMIDTTMETDNKLFVVSTLANQFPPQIYLWRNYQYPIDGITSRYVGTITGKVWESLRASSCAPTYFDEFTCGNDKHQDGGCIANNPTAIAIHEAKCLWPDRKIDIVVSMGTGKTPVRENKGGFLERTVVEMIECATSVDRVHDLMQDTWPSDVYFRFNPMDDRFNCELDESRKEKLEDMREAARDYVKANDERFTQLCNKLLM